MKVYDNVIMATYLSGIYDVNRDEILPADELDIITEWAESIMQHNLQAVVFHNSLTKKNIEQYKNNITFVAVDYEEKYNTNVYRYFLYRDFIASHPSIKNIFVTDITDVVVVNNPFAAKLFTDNSNHIFCGDEPKLLHNDWMYDHSTHLRNGIADFADYEANNKAATLLNCGIVGGNIKIMQSFLEKICHLHQTYNTNNITAFTGDMGAFNYLLRTQFNNAILHGKPVNTIFKMYETSRDDCWFRHK